MDPSFFENLRNNIPPPSIPQEASPKTVMNDVPKVPIGDFENTLSFPSEETSLGSGLPSHLPKGDVPCPSSPSHGFLHHTIGPPKNAT